MVTLARARKLRGIVEDLAHQRQQIDLQRHIVDAPRDGQALAQRGDRVLGLIELEERLTDAGQPFGLLRQIADLLGDLVGFHQIFERIGRTIELGISHAQTAENALIEHRIVERARQLLGTAIRFGGALRLVELHQGGAEPNAPAGRHRPIAHALFQQEQIGLPLGDPDQVSLLPIRLDERLQALRFDREIADLSRDIDAMLELGDDLIDPARLGQRFRQRQASGATANPDRASASPRRALPSASWIEVSTSERSSSSSICRSSASATPRLYSSRVAEREARR